MGSSTVGRSRQPIERLVQDFVYRAAARNKREGTYSLSTTRGILLFHRSSPKTACVTLGEVNGRKPCDRSRRGARPFCTSLLRYVPVLGTPPFSLAPARID